MLESQRANLINQLQEAYSSGLPDVENPDKTSVFDANTNTMLCIGSMSVEEAEIKEAIEYFQQVANMSEGNPDPKVAKKGRFCTLAVQALTNSTLNTPIR